MNIEIHLSEKELDYLNNSFNDGLNKIKEEFDLEVKNENNILTIKQKTISKDEFNNLKDEFDNTFEEYIENSKLKIDYSCTIDLLQQLGENLEDDFEWRSLLQTFSKNLFNSVIGLEQDKRLKTCLNLIESCMILEEVKFEN